MLLLNDLYIFRAKTCLLPYIYAIYIYTYNIKSITKHLLEGCKRPDPNLDSIITFSAAL